MRDVTEAILDVLKAGERAALATVIRTAGSTPQVAGARLLVRKGHSVKTGDGDLECVGTVGGGRIESVVIDELKRLVRAGHAEVFRRHLGRDLGMCCGGEMEFFLEPIESAPHLLMLGAGHIAQPTVRFAEQVGFTVTVVDAREELNNAERFANADRILTEPAEAIRTRQVAITPNTYIVICTHDHTLDEEALRVCADKGARYVGMIGSERKVIQVYKRIAARLPELSLDGVFAPVGLDLGALTPEEIGLAIVAELVAVRRGGSGQSMNSTDALRVARAT